MGGLCRQAVQEFAVTISVSLILSLIISLTLTPMMCARLLKHENKQHGWLYQLFERGFRRPAGVVYARPACRPATPVSGPCWSCWGRSPPPAIFTSSFPRAFFPEQDTGLLQGITEAATDISFPAMVQRQQAIIDTVLKDPAVESVTHYIGPGGPTPTLNQGRVFVVLKPLSERRRQRPAGDTTARSRAREDAGHRALSAGGPGHHHRGRLSTLYDPERYHAIAWLHLPGMTIVAIGARGEWRQDAVNRFTGTTLERLRRW